MDIGIAFMETMIACYTFSADVYLWGLYIVVEFNPLPSNIVNCTFVAETPFFLLFGISSSWSILADN